MIHAENVLQQAEVKAQQQIQTQKRAPQGKSKSFRNPIVPKMVERKFKYVNDNDDEDDDEEEETRPPAATQSAQAEKVKNSKKTKVKKVEF